MKSNSKHILLLAIVAAVFFCLGVFVISSSAASFADERSHFVGGSRLSVSLESPFVDTEKFESLAEKYMDLPGVRNDVKEGMNLKLWKTEFLHECSKTCSLSDFRQIRDAVDDAFALITSDFSGLSEENISAFKADLGELTGNSSATADSSVFFGLRGPEGIEGAVVFSAAGGDVLYFLHGDITPEAFDTFCRVLSAE